MEINHTYTSGMGKRKRAVEQNMLFSTFGHHQFKDNGNSDEWGMLFWEVGKTGYRWQGKCAALVFQQALHKVSHFVQFCMDHGSSRPKTIGRKEKAHQDPSGTRRERHEWAEPNRQIHKMPFLSLN
jgi:hypothetical protein